ncbi:PREDICTED: glutaredoxin-C10-like [Tarenaya hassleriana]|uniref:glutaredoxin-C10-like n=1 Tax=Tarenaya hassleriana TaxID=28532 RepID=UPI00053CA6C1|nr:PREDICTED: glutaredoxin-C10-like [Tarenaya hassleriana]
MKAMRGVRNSQNDAVRLDLTIVSPPHPSPAASLLSIDAAETAEVKIRRLISEHPVIIFTRSSSCCMCHVMKKLLSTVGVHPTVIELDETEISDAAATVSHAPPAIFIGGACVGGLESLVALHLSGHLVPRLVQVGALWV